MVRQRMKAECYQCRPWMSSGIECPVRKEAHKFVKELQLNPIIKSESTVRWANKRGSHPINDNVRQCKTALFRLEIHQMSVRLFVSFQEPSPGAANQATSAWIKGIKESAYTYMTCPWDCHGNSSPIPNLFIINHNRGMPCCCSSVWGSCRRHVPNADHIPSISFFVSSLDRYLANPLLRSYIQSCTGTSSIACGMWSGRRSGQEPDGMRHDGGSSFRIPSFLQESW